MTGACVQADGPLSGAAALATVSAFHSVPFEVAELAELTPFMDLRELELAMMLAVARTVGFDAVPLEGGYDDLPEVPLPMVVVLRDRPPAVAVAGAESPPDAEGPPRYGVLFAVDAERVTLGDPETGKVEEALREPFSTRWTGDVIQLTPNGEERALLISRLASLRDPRARLARAVGWVPPYGRRVSFVALAAGALAAGAWITRGESPAAAALGLAVTGCLVGSLWSWLAADTCTRCSKASALVGSLQVAPAGALLYLALLAGLGAGASPAAIAGGLAIAAGAHGGLLFTLGRARLRCDACIGVAVLAWGASLLTVARGDIVPVLWTGLTVSALAATLAGLRVSRDRDARVSRAVAERLARAVAAEPRRAEEGRVEIVVYKRHGCPACAFYESVIRPGLLAELGESVALDERELGRERTGAPLIVVRGAVNTVFLGLPREPFADVRGAVVEALEAGAARSGGELRVIGG
jgi:hypothetical protein